MSLPKDTFKHFSDETWLKWLSSFEVAKRRAYLLSSIEKWNKYYEDVILEIPQKERTQFLKELYNEKTSNWR